MADWRAQYWDSPLFISYLTGTMPERVQRIDELLLQYDKGGLALHLGTFAMAEVRRVPRFGAPSPPEGQEGEIETEPYDPERMRRLQDVFRSRQLNVWNLTERIALKAAGIGDRYPRLLPGDCVHIATALAANCDVLFTYDGAGRRRRPDEMLRYDGRIDGLRIMEPFVASGPMFDPPSVLPGDGELPRLGSP